MFGAFSYRLGVRLSFDYSSEATIADASNPPEPVKRVDVVLPRKHDSYQEYQRVFPYSRVCVLKMAPSPCRYTMLSRADAQI